jgi:hypothetical protein
MKNVAWMVICPNHNTATEGRMGTHGLFVHTFIFQNKTSQHRAYFCAIGGKRAQHVTPCNHCQELNQ